MLEVELSSAAIVRTERGLTLAGTRITLYDILTYLKAEIGFAIDDYLGTGRLFIP